MCGIYMIENMTSGSYYIGSTNNLKKRKKEHFSGLRRGKHFNTPLQRAYDKGDQLSFIVLLEAEEKDLLSFEQVFIDQCKPAYNQAKVVGPRFRAGITFNHSEQTKKKIADKLYGSTYSEERKKNISKTLSLDHLDIIEEIEAFLQSDGSIPIYKFSQKYGKGSMYKYLKEYLSMYWTEVCF